MSILMMFCLCRYGLVVELGFSSLYFFFFFLVMFYKICALVAWLVMDCSRI